MFSRWFRKVRRSVRNWNTDPARLDRNAVIQRVVAAAAKESHTDSGKVRTVPPPTPTPLAAQLMGQSEPLEEPLSVEEIGARAHAIWLRNGKPQGSAATDWTQAEAELRAERRAQP